MDHKLESQEKIKQYVTEIFRISSELNKLTGRPFTPDGHIVGSIGEIYAKLFYGVELHPPSHRHTDGKWQGREVQIKATQRISVDLKGITDLLLVLKINSDGSFEEIYNGDGKRPWNALSHRKITRAGEINISLKKLHELNLQVKEKDKIPCINQ